MKRSLKFVCAALLAVAPANVALAQGSDAENVSKVIENVFPGFTDPGYAKCILEGANADQGEQIASAGASGSYRSAEAPLKEVAMKPQVQECIISAGLPRFPI